MKETIINYIKNNPYCTMGNLCAIYDGKKSELNMLVNNLVDNGDIIIEDDTFITPYNLGLIKAVVVSVKHHFAFVNIEESDEDVIVEEKYLHGALLDDIVYLRYEVMFEVIKIVKRKRKYVVGELYCEGIDYCLDVNGIATDNTKFIVNNYRGKEKEILKCEITDTKKNEIFVKVIEKIGDKNEPGIDITRVLIEHDCPIQFNDEVKESLSSIPLEVDEKELIDRVDLRNELIVTIDGEDAKDLDDAVSAKKLDNGYLVGVHIADVSHYVEEYSPLDKEAFNRGTSIYVADRVVPMLPYLLSNGICSLNPHVDRLTISCFIELDRNGNVISSTIKPTVINSKHRLTYTYVNKVLEEKIANDDLTKLIQLLNEVAILLRGNKKNRGELDLSIPELKVVVNEKGEVIDVKKRIQGDGEKLIEDLMILANEQVAETIYRKNLPFIYRIHENPPAKRMDNLTSFASRLGFRVPFDSLNVKPKDLQKLLENAKYSDKYQILGQVLLRSLAKARYSTNNKGHFGLASKCYTHFTSPIRRYPDLTVHRYLRKYLFDNNLENAFNKIDELNFIAENSSMKERRAITVERETTDIKCAEYMQKFIGAEFSGYITGMNNSGLFVELENGVSGKISFETMSDYYRVDDKAFHAFGQRKGKTYTLGDKVLVVVESSNKDAGEINLQIKNEARYLKNYNQRKKMRRK